MIPGFTLFPYTTLFRSVALCFPAAPLHSQKTVENWGSRRENQRANEQKAELQSLGTVVYRPRRRTNNCSSIRSLVQRGTSFVEPCCSFSAKGWPSQPMV